MIFFGIDPGKTGGVAFIDGSDYTVYEMPVNSIGEMDAEELFRLFDITGEKFCIIEKAQTMPRQGIVSAFNYGKGYGKIQAVLEILNIPYQEIHSNSWKKEFSLIKKDKKHSVAVAEKLFPLEKFRGPKGGIKDGKAEAMLLAEYAKRKYNK